MTSVRIGLHTSISGSLEKAALHAGARLLMDRAGIARAVLSLSGAGLGPVEMVAWVPLAVLALAVGLVPALVTALSLAPVQQLVGTR